jgi:hypothetical protein
VSNARSRISCSSERPAVSEPAITASGAWQAVRARRDIGLRFSARRPRGHVLPASGQPSGERYRFVRQARARHRCQHHLVAARCLVRRARGRDTRHHRPQRGREEYAAQDPVAHHAADHGTGARRRPGGVAAGSWHRVSSRSHRTREHLPERRHPRHASHRDERGSSTRSSRSPRWSGFSIRR